MTMTVLVCIPCLLTGGTEIQTLSLVKALLKAGHTVVTVCYFEHTRNMVSQYEQAGSRVVCLSPKGVRPQGVWTTTRFLYKGLRHVVKAEKPDVVHVQYMAPGAIPIVLLRLLGVKRIIATAHTAADIYPSLRLLHWLQRHLLTAFTCITQRAEESFFGTSQLYTSETKLAKRNHFTIYNTLPDYISPLDAPRQQHESLTIGVVSRLERIKGMDLVIPAFAQVAKQYSAARLLVVGDGSMRDAMEQQVAESGISGCVEFAGRQPQDALQDYYDRFDILLMPSRSEGYGLTALEGMARGCVVVATNVGGLPEVVINGETGLLHRKEDINDMVKAISQLIDNPLLMTSMSQAAVNRAKLFTAEQYDTLIADLYAKLINGRYAQNLKENLEDSGINCIFAGLKKK